MTEGQTLQSLSYTTDPYNTLPSPYDPYAEFNTKSGLEFIKNDFGNLIKVHELESRFSIGLLRRHFCIEGVAKAVTFNNVSTCWPHIPADGKVAGDTALPSTWMIVKISLVPCDCYLSSSTQPLTSTRPSMRPSSKGSLFSPEKTGLPNLICLGPFPESSDDAMALEMTQGKANIGSQRS